MNLTRKEYEAAEPVRPWFYTRIEPEDATISSLSIGNLEAQDYPREIIIEAKTPRPDLTEAFRNPLLLRGSGFTSMNEQFTWPSKEAACDRPLHAILIKTATCKVTVVAILIVVVLFSIMAGSAAGF
ncbi:hypothetical protein BU25DRAFT_417859 [Macroventuria anomochaeta]|uniref:Uncharacterized protein n=1 Tax=Macroventuria anomochaeta TaxID=301207 RepID=A0ACB6SF48_9PLEO|nr:uncharacterized protein BU25DRAFT_417859 [Macroventuria anomochaeta]KAF2632112.1 hypothetical protein BU25DRAFT_417859 [Macroventuria anomochaeta]